jgi:hypothetical protein
MPGFRTDVIQYKVPDFRQPERKRSLLQGASNSYPDIHSNYSAGTRWRSMVSIGQKGKFALVAFLVLIGALLFGYAISEIFNVNILLTVSTIFTGGILLAALYGELTEEPAEPDNSSEEVSETDEDSPSSQEGSTRTERIGPTSGLRPYQIQIQNTLIEIAYEEFEENPFSFMVTHQAPHLIAEVANRTGPDKTEVRKVWKFCRDDELFRKRGNSWRITPKFVFRAQEIGLAVHLDDTVQDEILDSLMQEYQNEPHRPQVSEQTLLDAFDQDNKIIIQNIWYLCEKDYLEREAFLGGNANYEITSFGRRMLA